jgi:RND family efflux transporter MFP subunit
MLLALFTAACPPTHRPAPEAIGAKRDPASVQLAAVERAGVPSVLRLPAQLAAYQEVSIFPRVNGYVRDVFVDIGTRVSIGSRLMVLEAPELEQATSQAKERYAKVAADYSIDKERYQRLLEASKTDGAISALDLSTAKAKVEADSSLTNAEREAWRMQQTMQSYLSVTAPFSGVITERNVHPGALVSAATRDRPILELKEIARLRLQVDVPEGIATALRRNDTISFYTSAFPGKQLTGVITRKSMNVSLQLRSERVEIDVDNRSGRLAPGMYADVVLTSRGNPNALSVPKTAVVTTTERKYVIVVRDGKTVRVDVSTGNEAPDRVEIFGALTAGERVVANASDDIKDGVAIARAAVGH